MFPFFIATILKVLAVFIYVSYSYHFKIFMDAIFKLLAPKCHTRFWLDKGYKSSQKP